ncbi:MAG: phosphate signaling complex protein PhoU [Planctomycetota bacterium]|nr:phosphate signaling complex protein PhoU [Planctomycetota bacterium]MDA1252352.1 phosphate signaling complex protein PhoU [Planctomycetota bacterium]
MSIHLTRDIEQLHHDVLRMCSLVEGMIFRAVDGLQSPELKLVKELSEADDEIDQMDVQIEEECLKILALYQPVALDLRRITTVLKISGELERVADLAVNIAERGAGLIGNDNVIVPARLQEMAKQALAMLYGSIDSYVELDSRKAREILERDKIVDQLNADIIEELQSAMRASPNHVQPALHLFSVSRHLERVADHATNVAEDVVFMVEGEIIRHRHQSNSAPA